MGEVHTKLSKQCRRASEAALFERLFNQLINYLCCKMCDME